MDYLLKSSACMAAFYGLYFFGFRRLTFHAINRFYLLASLALSLTIPMLNYERKEVVFVEPKPIIEQIYSEEITTQITDNQAFTNNILPEKTAIFQVDWMQVLSIIYLSGMTIMLLIFLRNIAIILRQITSATSTSLGYRSDFSLVASASLNHQRKRKIIILNSETASTSLPEPSRGQRSRESVTERSRESVTERSRGNASFFNYIFLNPENLNSNEQELIIAHESFHAQLFHTLDLLLLGILKAVFWFNPIIYFYHKSLKQIHEYEVDALMSATHDSHEYAHLLLKLGVAPNSLIINQFSTKPLSDRIKFLFTKPTKNMKKLLYFLAIPIIGIGVMAFAEEKVVRVFQEKMIVKKNSKKSSTVFKEIVPKIKKEKLLLDTLRKEIISQIDSSKFSYAYNLPGFKFSLAEMDSFKISANNQLLIEGKDFILKENKIFLDPKYKDSKTKLHLYAKAMGGGSLLYPNLAKLEEMPYPKLNKVKNLPLAFLSKDSVNFPTRGIKEKRKFIH